MSNLEDEIPAPATLLNFSTASMAPNPGAVLRHEVRWESSTGNLGDLSEVLTREHVSWPAAPAEFGAPGEYAAAGEHHGLGQGNATPGGTKDDHGIFATGCKYHNIPDGSTSPLWTMKQQYEVKYGSNEWEPIPGATYEITRWYQRKGQAITAYVHKKGTGTDPTEGEASQSVDGWFEIEVSKPTVVDFTEDKIEPATVDKWNEDALKKLQLDKKTAFFQKGATVVILHPEGKGAQPYIDWVSARDDWDEGEILMASKGGAFGAGSIKVTGVQDRGQFEAAIKRISKKKVEY